MTVTLTSSSSRRRRQRSAQLFAVLTCWLLLVRPGIAAADQLSDRAALHFSRGVDLARGGDLEGAAGEFETAYATSPHPAVLYNLGQTYATLGRPVEAVSALERYLSESGDIPPERRREVEDLIGFHRKRIGRLSITVSPTDAELALNGKRVAVLSSDVPLEVAAGTHVLVARHAGYQPAVATVFVQPGQTESSRLILAPAPAKAPTWLEVRCAIPDAAVHVDGILQGTTPLQRPIAVSAGRHEVTFSRAGYVSQPVIVQVDAATASVDCRLYRARLSKTQAAWLRVVTTAPHATVSVDEVPYSGELLPPGKHTVRVDSPGYDSWKGVVTLPVGRATLLEPALALTPTRRRQLESEARSRRKVYAYVGAGLGAALGGTAGILYAFNSRRYEQYAADAARLSRELSSRPTTPRDAQRVAELNDTANAIQRLDYLALATGLLGVAALGGSVALYVSAGLPTNEPIGTSSPIAGAPRGAVFKVGGTTW